MNEIEREHSEEDRRAVEEFLHADSHCAICDKEFSIHGPRTCGTCDQNICSRCWSVTYETCRECAMAQWRDLRTYLIKSITESEFNHSFTGEQISYLEGGRRRILDFEANRGPHIKVIITEKWE